MKKTLLVALTILISARTVLADNGADKSASVPPVTPKMRPIPWDPAPLPKVEIPADRPRIWFRAAQVPELRKRCQTTCAATFEQIRQSVATVEGKSPSQAFNLAFLYQMTGDATYARRAIAIVRKTTPFEWMHYNGAKFACADYCGNHADVAACVFDYCYDQLTPDDKKAIGEIVHTQLARCPYRMEFHETYWVPGWLSEVLALYGAGIDDKMVEEQLAAVNRVVHQFTATADQGHADSSSGDYHHQFNFHWYTPEMWLAGTGENLFRTCGYFGTQPTYNMYLVLPVGHWITNDGDGPTDPQGGCHLSFMPHRSTFAYYGMRNDNPFARWLGRHWFQEACRTNAGGGKPWEAIVFAESSGTEWPLEEMPRVKLFPSNNVAILRSGWNLDDKSTDTVAAFYCRPLVGHAHYDAGHFVIWRGLDQLVQRNGFYANPNSEYHKNFFVRTVAHNCLTIYDPQEKPAHGGTTRDGGQLAGNTTYYATAQRLLKGTGGCTFRGDIHPFVDRPEWTYLFADITPAYDGTKASHVARAFLWMKPSTFLVCDWATSAKAEFTKRWLLHVATRPAIDGSERVVSGSAQAGILESSDTHRLTVTRGTSKLFVEPLLPEKPLVRCLGGEGYAYWSDGKNWDPYSGEWGKLMHGNDKEIMDQQARTFWRIEIEPATAATEDVFLTLLDTAAADAASPPSTAKVLREGNTVGAEIRNAAGARTVLFYPDGRASIDGEMIGEVRAPLKPFENQEPTSSKTAANGTSCCSNVQSSKIHANAGPQG